MPQAEGGPPTQWCPLRWLNADPMAGPKKRLHKECAGLARHWLRPEGAGQFFSCVRRIRTDMHRATAMAVLKTPVIPPSA